jgi:hypothetical protein
MRNFLLAAAAVSLAGTYSPAARSAGQPTAVSNLPVVVTGRHKEAKPPKGKAESQKSRKTQNPSGESTPGR